MNQNEIGQFTVGVFQDVTWAERGLEALIRHRFPSEALTILAKDTTEASDLIKKMLGDDGECVEVKGVGNVVARGPLVDLLQGEESDLATSGLSATMGRVGYQSHDAFIFETLTARGGVLVAIHDEPRAAEALSILHCYGGGYAAIGAWTGRVLRRKIF